jgi:hypothetical protein
MSPSLSLTVAALLACAGLVLPVQHAAAQTATASGPAPWPINVGAPGVRFPSDLDFSSELEAEKKAFVEFSRVRCTDCEGGYGYDAWAQQILGINRGYKAWETRIGGMAVGETLAWKGAQSKGLITIVSEEPVNGWRCKQLRWELAKGSERAERPGLFCFGKAGPYDGAESWTQVF